MGSRNKIIILSGIIVFFLFICTGCSKQTVNKEEITVFAAASLTESMEEAVKEFGLQNPNVKVNLHLASSSRLRTQIEQGVEADLFLSANKKHYDALEEQEFISKGCHFLSNAMAVIIPKENLAQIETVKDLQKTCKLVIAEEEVPAGRYARQIIHAIANEAGEDYEKKVLSNIVSEELNVKQVANKVVIGEGDAAFVYVSDITQKVKPKVKVLPIESKHNVNATYWIGQLKQYKEKEYAKEFYAYLIGEGQNIFKKHGFETALKN